jgi:protein-tyrosine kinase
MEPIRGSAQKLILQSTLEVATHQHQHPPADVWGSLLSARLDRRQARKSRIAVASRYDDAHVSFDVLRTKLLRVLRQNRWTSMAITAPTSGCGTSVLALNLVFSLANLADCRTVLVDLNFRRPRIGKLLGLQVTHSTDEFVGEQSSIEETFVRYGATLAVGVAGKAMDYSAEFSAELLQNASTHRAIRTLKESLRPDVMLCVLPPLLHADDVVAFLPNVDCTMLVAGAGLSTLAEVEACERELAHSSNVLGVVLNKCRHLSQTGVH